jgi:hypothetical protein
MAFLILENNIIFFQLFETMTAKHLSIGQIALKIISVDNKRHFSITFGMRNIACRVVDLSNQTLRH